MSKKPFAQLIKFLSDEMQMQHIYQPLMVRSLVDANGKATIRQLAHAFLEHDESQLKHYEGVIKKMPLKVLKKREIVCQEGDLVTLNIKGKLTFEQKAKIRMLCEQKIQEFILNKGMSLWDYRMLGGPVKGSVYYEVMKESGGRCALCGTTSKERPLDVDHILPRSKGGSSDKENLQVLCSKCNRTKGNRDKTNWKNFFHQDAAEGCIFCWDNLDKTKVVAEYDHVYAIEDGIPVTKGHLLVIPKRHAADWFIMTEQERFEAEELLRLLKGQLESKDKTITGFNIGMNCGVDAGQTIHHAHIHLIPRRKNDTKNPIGGVRGVIPGARDYTKDERYQSIKKPLP
ncbi:HIT domain-containing protein [Pseudodesulfovibrio sp.]|nr:HIT domain-containing protein [Pseudodesulfovibrio sp.]